MKDEDLYEPIVEETKTSSSAGSTAGDTDEEMDFMPKNPSAHRATFAKKGDTQATLADF